MNRFTDWLHFDTAPDHNGAAVYEVRIVVDGVPVRLGRILGTDPDGILVKGCTSRMTKRWRESHTARRRGYGSSTMNLLYYLERYTPLPRVYPTSQIKYRFRVMQSGEQAKSEEESMLKGYLTTFGELPPLNSVLPNRDGGYELGG